MTKNLIEQYLTDIGEIRGTGSNVPETSFYPPLEKLLSEFGKSLSPKVRCVINLANRGAGLPDGLADSKVIILDPCCGTGAYLRAALRRSAPASISPTPSPAGSRRVRSRKNRGFPAPGRQTGQAGEGRSRYDRRVGACRERGSL